MGQIFTPLEAILKAPKMRGVPHNSQQTCTKILFRGYEISIGMDNSCGMADNLTRTEIRVYQGDNITDEVTSRFIERTAYSAEDLFTITQNIAKLGD